MATVSRFRAIVSFKGLRLSGFAGWLMWLVVHVTFLTGFKNRFQALLHWANTFLGGARAERTITMRQVMSGESRSTRQAATSTSAGSCRNTLTTRATRRSMSSRRGPTDPRLLHYTRGTRRYLIATVALGGVTAGLVVAQAWLLTDVISRVVIGRNALAQVRTTLGALLVVVLFRAAVGWLGAWMADRASAAAKSDLRTALVERIARLGPGGIDREKVREPGRARDRWHRRTR